MLYIFSSLNILVVVSILKQYTRISKTNERSKTTSVQVHKIHVFFYTYIQYQQLTIFIFTNSGCQNNGHRRHQYFEHQMAPGINDFNDLNLQYLIEKNNTCNIAPLGYNLYNTGLTTSRTGSLIKVLFRGTFYRAYRSGSLFQVC